MTWNKSGIEGVGGVGLTDGAAASEPSDEELVGRAREGYQGAFSELVKRYQDRIVSAVAQRVSDREHALDLAQEVFVKAYRALPRFEARSSFYTWIYRIAINTSLSYRRKRRRAGSMLSLDRLGAGQDGDMHGLVPAPGQSPVRVVEERERAELVRRAIAELDLGLVAAQLRRQGRRGLEQRRHRSDEAARSGQHRDRLQRRGDAALSSAFDAAREMLFEPLGLSRTGEQRVEGVGTSHDRRPSRRPLPIEEETPCL